MKAELFPPPQRSAPVYAMFVASGAAALVYQVIWLRWLGLVFGNTTVSVTIVLASFMGGLALGSFVAGRVLARVREPMRVYARVELAIGLIALAFPWLAQLTQHGYTALLDADSPVALTLALRGALAVALLLVPTTLMGTTLPLLTAHFERGPGDARAWKAGLLYAANTAGAAVGITVCAFVLLELLGVRASSLLAACLNFTVAGLALRFARTPAAALPPMLAEPPRPRAFEARVALCALALSGAAALASEVLWTRALEVLLGNSTYAFSMIVLSYLVGIAAGSACLSQLLGRLRALPHVLLVLLGAMALWTLGCIALIDQLRALLVENFGRMLGAGALLAAYAKASAVLFPLAFLSGAMFPVATRLLERPEHRQASGEHIASAGAWNTIGSVVGSLGAGFLIAPHFDFFEALYLVAAIYAGGAALLGAALLARSPRAGTLVPVAACALIACIGLQRAFSQSTFLDRMARNHPEARVLFHRPGVQGITTVLANAQDVKILLVNGTGMTMEGRDVRMMAHLPILLHENPRNTLVICFGMGSTYRSAITHGGQVTVVELVDEVLDAFDTIHTNAQATRTYPKGRMVVNDGRNFLLMTRERFDVITVDPPPPINGAGVNNLYSRDFIQLAKSRLAEGGIFAHWIPYPGLHAGVDSDTMLRMLVGTFVDVFPHALIMPSLDGLGFHIVGSERPIPPPLRERIEHALQIDAVRADMRGFPPDFLTRLAPWDQRSFGFGASGESAEFRFDPQQQVPLVTDDRPRLEFSLLADWRAGRSRSYPQLAW